MKIFNQLRLLVWKNFTLRKRQPLRNFLEIAWPLVIFFILVAVRTRRHPESKASRYYRPRALPSAGLLPFMQSFFCDYRGGYLLYSDGTTYNNLPDVQNSRFAKFVEDALPLIENGTVRDRILRLNTDYQNYLRDQNLWNQLYQMYQNNTNITRNAFRSFIRDPTAFQNYLQNQIGIKPEIVQQLMTAKLNQDQVQRLMALASTLSGNYSSLMQMIIGSGLNSLPFPNASPQGQWLAWLIQNMQIVQALSQGQSLTAAQIRKIACDDSSPVAIDNIVQVSQGNLSDVRKALCGLSDSKLQNMTAELRKQIIIPRTPSSLNTTMLLEQARVLQNLTGDLQNLYQDMLALQPLEKVVTDYLSLMQLASQGADLNELICNGRYKSFGTNVTTSSGSSSTFGLQQAMGSLFGNRQSNTQQTQRNTTSRPWRGYDNCSFKIQAYPEYLDKLKNKTFAMKLSFKDKCAMIDPYKRIDCGWPGMSPSQCYQLGCCFDSSIKGPHYCFYEPKKAQCGCLLGTALKTTSGASDRTNQPSYDRGFIQLSQLFLRGQILYTPDNPLTRKIIKNIQAELSDIGLLKDFAVWWLNNSDTIRASLQDVPLIYRGLMQNNDNSTRAAQQWRTFLQAQLRASNSTLADQLERLPNNTAIMAFLNSQNGTMNISNVMDNVDAMFRDAVAVYDCLDHDYFVGYPDEESLVLRATNTSTTPVIASFVFENVDGNSMPKHVKYKIRQDIDYTPRTDRIRSWYWKPGPRDGFTSNGYLNFGFVFLQDLIDRAVMSMMFNETVNEPGIYVQQFPYPCYIRDRFVWYIGGSMPLLMTLAWVYSVAMIIKGIVYEKEKKLKEVMKVMGLGRTVHWIAWFINSSFMMLITIVFLVLTMRFGRILTNSNPFIVFLFLVVFMVSTIMMCFLISVFFSRANVAAACGGIIFFITYLPYSIVRWFEAYMSTSEKALSCLSSTTAFGLACSYFARYEEQGTGIQWDNLYSSPLEGDGFSLGYALTMMMVDSVLYGVLTWYLEAVMPGQFGIPKPWYFPVQKSYWFPKKASNSNQTPYQHNSTSNGTRSQQWVSNGLGQAPDMHEIAFKGDENDQTDKETPIEAEPTHLPLGVSIKDLVKIYKSGNKLAVDGLNLNLYENQITSFLGHNGAGKTTTMSILTGLYPPTHGTAVISGMDIRTDIDLVRKSLGMCPQYNVLFDQLTVEDHLWFYSSLKGMEKSKIPDEIEKFLKDIGLENKRHELACNLSGGMKRKLSVGMAFIAGSKVVILDEPTAGVDPYARRGIWDLLLKYKPGRTVLLSTHHMDEADVLGDRIAIISQGKLQCCGSSLFLKGHYGNGYYLTLTKKSPGERPTTAGTLRDVKLHLEDISESASSDEGVFLDSGDASEKGSLASSASGSDEADGHCSADSVSSFIKKHIPTAQLVEHVGSELTYVLPTEAAKEGKFQDMFEDLDRNLGKLRVGSYGVSDTTLEEVFLKVAEEAVDENADLFAAEVPKRRFSFRHQLFSRGKVRDSLNDKIELLDNMEEENPDNRANDPADDAVDGSYNVDGKSSGMKLLFRQFWSLVIKRFHHTRRNRKAFLSQIILPAIFVCIAMIVAQIRPFYEMPAIKLSTKMFQDSVPSEQYMMFADDDANDAYSNSLTDIFLNYPGLGTACMDGSCPKVPINFKGPITGPITNTPNCSCSTGISICPAGAGGPKPRQWTSYSGDILQNVTGRYIPELLLKTHDQYIRKRYGGITFGDNIPNLPSSIRESQDPVVKRMISYRNTKAWYDNKGYHALPTYVNVLSNNILRNKAKMKGLNPTEYGISTFNHPMNYTKEQLNDQTFIKQAVDVLVAICVVFALSFVPASFVVFLVNERATKAKHLHMVSGVRPYIYWTANYFWDMCSYLIPAIICVLIFLAFNDESYTSAMNFPPTFLLLLLYGWAVTPLMYPASYIFSVPSTAYIVMICANLFIGINCTLATFILEMFQDDQELIDINNSLKAIFLIFPNYCLGRGLIDLAKNQFMDIFSRFGQNLVKDPFSWDITGRNIMAMIIQGFVFFAINVLIEYRFFIKQRPVKNVVNTLSEEDDDVKQERRRVVSGTGSSTDAMRLVNLTKIFKVRSKVNVAVNQLCVGVSKGECFGLLGVNGAGKTTTFKMLTGDLPVTSGEAYVNGYSVLSEIHDAHQTMGYCPQFDALDELLTAKEHLYLYARLRGVPEAQIQKVVMSLIARMNLRQYQDVCAGKYSGGNKRKLSTAIALVGNPNIVFMDEPTTGMDPKARRFLWNIITSIVKEGRTVILTSHSMEECEALCNRVAIMVNGQFKCLGSPQHLKNKYGDGYTVVLRVAGPNPKTEQVSEFIKTVFPNAILKDQHLNMLEYQLPSQGLSVANVFGQLEANRKIFNIEDYSVSQTTLDQVFINFAKDQTDGIDDTRPKRLVANNIELPTMRYTQLVDGNILQQSVDV